MLSLQISQLRYKRINFILKTFDFSILPSDLVTYFLNIELEYNNASLSKFNFILLYFILLIDLSSKFLYLFSVLFPTFF